MPRLRPLFSVFGLAVPPFWPSNHFFLMQSYSTISQGTFSASFSAQLENFGLYILRGVDTRKHSAKCRAQKCNLRKFSSWALKLAENVLWDGRRWLHKKKWLLGQNGGTAGPETEKRGHFCQNSYTIGFSYIISVLMTRKASSSQ